MEDSNYLEKILGEKYNLSNYFENNTYSNNNNRIYAEPNDNINDYSQHERRSDIW